MLDRSNSVSALLMNVIDLILTGNFGSDDFALAGLRLLVASRANPRPTASEILSRMTNELDVMTRAAKLTDNTRIYASVPQEIVMHMRNACGTMLDVDISGWPESYTRTSANTGTQEADALILELMTSLFRGLLSQR